MAHRPTQFTTNVTPSGAGIPDNVVTSTSPFERVGLPEFKHNRRPVRRAPIKTMSARLAFILSLVFHVTAPILTGLLAIVIMLMMGMHLEDLWMKAKPKPKDIVFILVPENTPEQKPLNKKTPYRAHRNSRAGGESRPDRPLNLDKLAQTAAPAASSAPAKPAPPTPEKAPPVMHPVEEVKAQPAMTAPIAKPAEQQPEAAAEPSAKASTSATATASAGATQSGSMANGQTGNKSAPLGVDALQVADFGPYMKDLQVRIRQSWNPPRNSESKRVIVSFRVKRDGSLETAKVFKTSGEPMADEAALAAIQEVFPFRPLPQGLADEGIDIQFTFDYNVFGDKPRLKRRLDNG